MPKLALALLCALIALTAPAARAQLPAPFNTTPLDLGTAPDDNMAVQGVPRGEFEVGSEGQAIYRVPIPVPPGTNGMEPQVSLVYDSHSSNGPVGVGWSLVGPSAITRCGKELLPDTVIDPVDFDANDQFCLDGQRLVAAADGSFRTQVDTFTRVEAVEGTASDPSYFRARTRDGRRLEFGRTADSRIEAEGRTEAVVWSLNKVSDHAGNYYTILYGERSDLGFYAPLRIEYTGHEGTAALPYNRVDFHYEARADVSRAYLSGSLNSAVYRLARIETFAESTPVRAYVLRYQIASTTGQSRLEELQQCAFEDDLAVICLTPLSFSWQQNGWGFEAGQKWLPKNGGPSGISILPTTGFQNTFVGDFNGDSRADYMWLRPLPGNSAQRWHVATSTGTSFQFSTWLSPNPLNGTPVYNESYQHIGDFNGDGRDDLMWYRTEAQAGWRVALSNGTQFGTPSVWLPTGAIPLTHANRYIADLNGDARADYLWYVASGVQGWYASLSTGSGFTAPALWLAANAGGVATLRNGRQFLADMNSDGFPDLFWLQAGDVNWRAALSNGTSGFANPEIWLDPTDLPGQTIHNSGNEVVADFNSDGSADYMWYRSNAGWYVALSNGRDSFKTPTLWLTQSDIPGISIASSARSTADMNHDGRNDFMWQISNGRYYVAFSNSADFTVPWVNHWYGSSGYLNVFSDFSGDGMPDLLSINPGTAAEGSVYRRYDHGLVPDLLDGVIGTLGYELTLEYKPLTDASVYARGNGAVFPQVDVQTPTYVLARTLETDGITTSSLTEHNYFYRGLRADLWRGISLGFAEVEDSNLNQGMTSLNLYNQDFPRQGTMRGSELKTTGGSRRSLRDVTVLVSSSTPGQDLPTTIYRYWISKDVEDSYEVDGTTMFLRRTREQNNVDAYNNPAEVRSYASDGYEKRTTTTYLNDEANWLIGLPTRVSIEGIAPNLLSNVTENVTRTTAFEYYSSGPHANGGRLFREITEPDLPALKVTKEYGRDVYGNITSTAISGTGFTARSESVQYDSRGQFPASMRNALNHLRKQTYDPRFGRLLTDSFQKTTGDENSFFTTTYTYDVIGRDATRTDPDDSFRYEWRAFCIFVDVIECPANGTGLLTDAVFADGKPAVYVVTDLLGREVRRATIGFAGVPIYQDTEYDPQGRVEKKSLEYFSGSTPAGWTRFTYDDLDRLDTVTEPDDSVTNYDYAGLTLTQTNDDQQVRTEVRNSVDQLVRVTDDDDKFNTYVYDGFELLLQSTDALGNLTDARYDAQGHKLSIDDPDGGLRQFVSNALGQVTSETDAKNANRSYGYDLLGRLQQRTESDGQTTFTYDTATRGLGKLASVSGTTGGQSWSKTFSYETYGRPDTTTLSVDSRSYATSLRYDWAGRISQQIYPGGYAIRNVFNTRGFLQRVESTASTPVVFWTANAYSARGQVTDETLGNGLRTQRVFDPLTQQLREIKTGTVASPTSVQSLDYTWDSLGNLEQRRDLNQGLTENFGYDNLNRLTSAQVVGRAAFSFTYNEIGNLSSKSDVGTTYTYGENGAGPHAVTSITGGPTSRSFGYDANGNQTSRGQSGLSTALVTYTSFDKPSSVAAPSGAGFHVSQFRYDESRELIVRRDDPEGTSAPIETTYSAAGVFEELLRGATTEKRFFIRAGDRVIAVRTIVGTAAATSRFVHRDHLGSVDRITDWPTSGAASVVEQMSFDAFGKQRNATTWFGAPATPIIGAPAQGFTGHEQLDLVGLIHMGGRVYDPTVGRFLSADPYMQFPDDTQGLNRYSYVLNNPLSYVDPSGYSVGRYVRKGVNWVKRLGKRIGRRFSSLVKNPAALLSGVACALGNVAGCYQFTLLVTATAIYGNEIPKAVQRLTQVVGILANLPSPVGNWSSVITNFAASSGKVLIERATRPTLEQVLGNLLNVAALATARYQDGEASYQQNPEDEIPELTGEGVLFESGDRTTRFAFRVAAGSTVIFRARTLGGDPEQMLNISGHFHTVEASGQQVINGFSRKINGQIRTAYELKVGGAAGESVVFDGEVGKVFSDPGQVDAVSGMDTEMSMANLGRQTGFEKGVRFSFEYRVLPPAR